MHYFIHFTLIVLFFSVQACDQDNFSDIETNYNTEPLQIKGSYNGPDESVFVDFQFDIGTPDTSFFGRFFYWNADVSEGELGPTLIVSVYNSLFSSTSVPYFGMQFWSDQLPADRLWNKEEVADFFAPGNTFALGQGPGLVDVSFRYPGVNDIGFADDISSKSSLLENPEGQLIVTKIEEFQFEGRRLTSTRDAIFDGYLISCTINAEIGLNRDKPNRFYDSEDLATDEVIELRDVELTFYVGS